jgi:hypothetical protein
MRFDTMRFDGVEIKVTVEGDQTSSAVHALRLPDDVPRWQIFFCEDVTAGVSAGTPLLDLGVVLRARQKPDDTDDTTVKLRPCRRSQLTDDWLADREGETDSGDTWENEVEADWSGERRVLAASCSAERADGVLRDGGRGVRSADALFSARQVAFLRDCGGVQVNLRTLTVLPPVAATRWKKVEGAPPDLEVRAERWTVADLDFLELSVVADIEDARERQAGLTEYVRSLGLVVGERAHSKTESVLRTLVGSIGGRR